VKTDWLNGRTVMVAGATGAIGRATCASLLRSGATVIALGRDPAKLAMVRDELKCAPERFQVLPLNGSDPRSWERVLRSALRFNPSVDAFIHAAGKVVPGAFLELTHSEIDSIIDANFRSVVASAGVIIPHMLERRRGHFIVVGSLGGIVPMPFETMYSATKFALRGFCLSLHEEVRSMGVTISLVSPGSVRSPMLDREGADLRAALTFVDSPAEPAGIAEEIVLLLKSRRREIVRPSRRRLQAMLVGFFPGIFGTLYPLLAAFGRRRLLAYRRTQTGTQDHNHDHRQSIQAA
jgi:short-subunit dehydrogenase